MPHSGRGNPFGERRPEQGQKSRSARTGNTPQTQAAGGEAVLAEVRASIEWDPSTREGMSRRCGLARFVSARFLGLVRDDSCGLEGFWMSVGQVGSTASAKDASSAGSRGGTKRRDDGARRRALRLPNAAGTRAAMRNAHHCIPQARG